MNDEIKKARKPGARGGSVIQALRKVATDPKGLQKEKTKFVQENNNRSTIFKKGQNRTAGLN